MLHEIVKTLKINLDSCVIRFAHELKVRRNDTKNNLFIHEY